MQLFIRFTGIDGAARMRATRATFSYSITPAEQAEIKHNAQSMGINTSDMANCASELAGDIAIFFHKKGDWFDSVLIPNYDNAAKKRIIRYWLAAAGIPHYTEYLQAFLIPEKGIDEYGEEYNINSYEIIYNGLPASAKQIELPI